jgi:hypothetical protein
VGAVLVVGAAPFVGGSTTAFADPGASLVSPVTLPSNGVWLESTDGGHYWDASGSGLCRIDATPAVPGGFAQNAGTCDVQAKKLTQAVVGPRNADGSYFVYTSDMSSKSGGPVRLTYDPTADSGKGRVIANSGAPLGGLNTVGFFADQAGSFKNSSVALGPCDQTPGAKTAGTKCLALYLGFARSSKIERINNVDQPLAAQSIETISKANDPRKGVRFGMGIFHNPAGTDDLYIDELGGTGVSLIPNVAQCTPSQGSADPAIAPPVNPNGGCAATTVAGITTTVPQGMAVKTDPVTGNSQFLYVADSPGATGAAVLRYHPGTGLQDIVSTSVNPYDSLLNPGQTVSTYTSVVGLAVNPHNGDLFIGDDPTATLANPPTNKGHLFTIKGVNGVAPANCVGTATARCVLPGAVAVPPVPAPVPLPPPPAAAQTCTLTVNVPSLAAGQTYWLQFTAHANAPISASWKIVVPQSAKLLLYPGNPFSGLADPVSTGSKGGSVASQNTSNTTSFAVSTAPTTAAPGTYTVQFFNASNTFGATTGTLAYGNDAGTPCPASPTSLHVLP